VTPVVALALAGCSEPLRAADWVPDVYGEPDGVRTALEADLDVLADEGLEGRLPGSDGDRAARAHVVARFAAAGLLPAGDDGYEQPFVDFEGRATANVLGAVPGSDPRVADEIVLVSAHHDHLGPGFPGASDDASGVASLLWIAERIAADPPRRTVLFGVFGSEESGFEGSEHWATHPTSFEAADVVYDVNLDMVGSLSQTGRVWALGAMDGTVGIDVVAEESADWPEGVVRFGGSSDLSDNVTFCARGVPYVFFWTPFPRCYHESCDTRDQIDVDGMIALSLLTERTARRLADATQDLAAGVARGDDVCHRPAR
jgi:hypothetical protein